MKPSQLNSHHSNSNGINQFKSKDAHHELSMSNYNSIGEELTHKGIADILVTITIGILFFVGIFTLSLIVVHN